MKLPAFLDIAGGYSRYFTAVPALSEELKRTGYRIRHDVYCRDLGFEPVRPDGMETDRYDAHAAHCLLKRVDSEEYVGCIRLVFAQQGDRLPFERICAQTIDRTIVDPSRMPPGTTAEISRLAVISRYRRRKGEARIPGTISQRDFGTAEQPRFPYIPVGLYLGMIAQARRHGVETLFMLTEPRLANHLGHLGVTVRRIGEPVEHRGKRVPSMLSVEAIVRGMSFVLRPMYEVIAREVDAAYASSGELR